jgi:hypothetical protein
MPGAVSLTGADVVTLNGRVFHDYANEDVAELTFEAELVKVQSSKNGNVIYALNAGGQMSKLKLRLLLGSPDDQYLNSLLASEQADLSGFTLIIGSFVKRVGDGQGNVTNVIYNVVGGVVDKYPSTKINAAGDVNQSVVEYMLTFGINTRVVM